MVRTSLLPLIAIIAAVATSAWAQPQGAPPNAENIRRACGADIQRLCSGIQPGGGRLMQCMRSHQSELSSACQAALAAAKPPQ